MKRVTAIFIVSALIALSALTVFADVIPFTMNLDTAKDVYDVGDMMYIKASMSEIKINNGFIAIGVCMEYDPEVIKAIPGDNGETAEVFLPEEWISDGERIENIVKNEDGTQAGKVLLNYIAPLDENGKTAYPLKSDDFYAVVKFECLKEASTTVKIDSENEYNCCTGFDDDGNIVSYKGKGSEIMFRVKNASDSANESKDSADPNQTGYVIYYIIVGSAVAVAAAVLIISKKRKK